MTCNRKAQHATNRKKKTADLSLYHNCDSTTIRRYHDAFNYDKSDLNYDMRSIRLQYDYDEKMTCSKFLNFFALVELLQMEAGVRYVSWIVVE